jgi:cellulose synthase/poly-beta-1,6-N-acetylglucosamine synthase-like glycosyltransferase
MTGNPRETSPPEPRHGKGAALVVVPILIVVISALIATFSRRLPAASDKFMFTLVIVNSIFWLVFVWWALHHLAFQLKALLTLRSRLRPEGDPSPSPDVRFVILYMTCDDFQEASCSSCVEQSYPETLYRVLICDDSRNPEKIAQVDAFFLAHRGMGGIEIEVVRRGDRPKGYKAGNLNHAIQQLRDGEDWIVVVDADQILPRPYLKRLAPVVAIQPSRVAFVQGSHRSDHSKFRAGSSTFQKALGMNVRLFYERDLPWRERGGFVPFLGHGDAVRRQVLKTTNGFPEVVSEDYAFTMVACENGYYGVYAEELWSWESFPKDFDSFLVRLRKSAGGTAQLFRCNAYSFLRGKTSLVEKYDLVMLLLWYPLSGLMLLNGFLSAYVCHRLVGTGGAAFYPITSNFLIALFFLPFAVQWSLPLSCLSVLRHWFWSLAINTSGLPIATGHFYFYFLSGHRPLFVPTPKGLDRLHPSLRSRVGSVMLGLSALALAWQWWSPFSPVLAAQGVAYSCLPLYCHINDKNAIGWFSRASAWIPGSLLFVGLYYMWFWNG